MPILQVHLLKGRSPGKKAELIRALTDACCRILGSDPASVRVILQEMDPENFGKNGSPFSAHPDTNGEAFGRRPG